MKQFFLSLIAVTFIFSVTSCTEPEDDNNDPKKPDVTNQNTYVGRLTVNQLNGTDFVMDSVRISLTANDTTNTMVMIMYQVKFSPRMPLNLDMTVKNIAYASNQNEYTLSGDSIVPYAMGGAFATYTITNLNGTMVGDSLKLSMKCGQYPLTFKGRN